MELSTVVLSISLEVCRLYGGFFTSPAQLLAYHNWKFLDVLSYLKYVFVGLAINELSGLSMTCTDAEVAKKACVRTGESIMQARGYDQYSMGFCAGMLVVYVVVCRFIAYVALRYFKA